MKFKNWLANLPLYIGAYVHRFATSLEYLGVALHMQFKTPVGIKAAAMKKVLEELSAKMVQENTAHKQAASQEVDKLSKALTSENVSEGIGTEVEQANVVQFGRKNESKD